MNLKGMFDKAKKWAGEHKVELVVGGFGLLCAGVGVYVGYEAGWSNRYSVEQEKAKELSSHLAGMIEGLVDECGFTSCSTTIKTLAEKFPKQFEEMNERCMNHPEMNNVVRDAYYEDGYIRQVLGLADDFRTLGLGALEEA